MKAKKPVKKPAKKITKAVAARTSKSPAKKVVKQATKKPAKKVAKVAAKTLAKKPVKKAAKSVAKKAVKKPVKAAAKKAPKKAAKKPVAKKASAKTAAKASVKKPAVQNLALAPKVYDGPAWPLMETILSALDDAKAEGVMAINVEGRSSVADGMVIATGRVNRHVAAIADQLVEKLKGFGQSDIRVEGLEQGDWVLVDAGNVIVHIFRPEVRAFYNLEKLWSEHAPHEKRED